VDRGERIFIGAVAGVVVGAGVAVTRRRLRAGLADLAAMDPELVASYEENRPRILEEPCGRCGERAGFRRREGFRLEQRVVQGGRLSSPVLQDQRVLFTYDACRACGAER
jgi:hypothetical protein